METINKGQVGKGMKNPALLKVKDSKEKKYFECFFCHKVYADKIMPHYKRMHLKKQKTKDILAVPEAKRVKSKPLSD